MALCLGQRVRGTGKETGGLSRRMERRISEATKRPRAGPTPSWRWGLLLGLFSGLGLLAVGCHALPALTGSSGSNTGKSGNLVGGGAACAGFPCSNTQAICPLGLHCFNGFCIDSHCRRACASGAGWTPEDSDGGPPPGLQGPCEVFAGGSTTGGSSGGSSGGTPDAGTQVATAIVVAGGSASSANFSLIHSVSQPNVGQMSDSSTNFRLSRGLLPRIEP